MKVVDLVGQRFSLLTVVGRAENNPQGKSRWHCVCDCGKLTVALRDGLARGKTTSCGCRKYAGFKQEHQRRTKYRTVEDWLANCKVNGTCLEWGGYIAPDGYAHSGEHLNRKIFRLIHGLSPQVVMHTCDNPKCINPAHLKAATFSENSRDMVMKGRSTTQKIPHHCHDTIKEMLNAGLYQEDVARLFGVTQSAISSIKRRKPWNH